ncbi:hypothetical protein GCM10028785_13750 [Hydrogenophaga soli]
MGPPGIRPCRLRALGWLRPAPGRASTRTRAGAGAGARAGAGAGARARSGGWGLGPFGSGGRCGFALGGLQALQGLLALLTQLLLLRAQAQGFAFGHGGIVGAMGPVALCYPVPPPRIPHSLRPVTV